MNILIKTALALLTGTCLLITSCGGENRQAVEVDSPEEVKTKQTEIEDVADVSFIDGMTGKLFHNYLQLQLALYNSDLDEAKKVAANMNESLSDERPHMRDITQSIAKANDLESARGDFSKLSIHAENLFVEGLSEGTIYKQYCPMSLDNEGAFWISDIKEINNPYFGEQMPHCGTIKEVITK